MLANNYFNVETIKETNDALILKVTGFVQDANGAQSDTLVVNAELLLHRTQMLNSMTPALTVLGFIPGEIVVGQTSNTFAYVAYADNQNPSLFRLTVVDANGDFQLSEDVVGQRSHSVLTIDSFGPTGVTNSTTQAAFIHPPRRLDIESLSWTMNGPANSSIELEWSGFGTAGDITWSGNGNGVFTADVANTDPTTFFSNGQSILISGDGPFTISAINSTTFTAASSLDPIANADIAAAVHPSAVFLSGSGYMGRNALQAEITPPNMYVNLGDICLSTHGMAAGSAYSIMLEIRKQIGFAQIPTY